MAKNYPLNFEELHEVDITPKAAEPTFVRLGPGITNADPNNNENIDQTTYLVDNGYGTSSVIGAQKTVSYSGHLVAGDPAMDFLASIEYELGGSRLTNYRFTDYTGNVTEGQVTIANLKIGGGDAGAKKEISFEVHFNGKPIRTARVAAETLTAVIAAGTVIGTTKFTATPAEGNTLAYKLEPADAGIVYENSFVSGTFAYTSGDNIEAKVDQYLYTYELNKYGRVAKFNSAKLAAADIASV